MKLSVIGLVLMSGISLGMWMQGSAGHVQESQEETGQAADQPGRMHKQLATLAGEWSTSTTFEMDGTIMGKPVEGTASLKSILDGRFLEQEESGVMDGVPYKATKTWGYNGHSNSYEMTWFWTNDTATLRGKGTSEDGGKTVKFDAGFEIEDGKTESMWVTLKMKSGDEFEIEIASKEGTKPFIKMTTTYTRKK